jgi:hypothetical protein
VTPNARVTWPDGKRFAFTVFDDTDKSTVQNVGPLYAFLADQGFRTTKSVWPVRGPRKPRLGGETLDDPHYLEWIRSLKAQGFEIGFHSATFHTSTRDETIRALDRFHDLFGEHPKTMANHAHCEEAPYWGAQRVSGINRLAYSLMTRGRKDSKFRGHIPGDELFWGDICRQRIKYMRNFVFEDINTLKACPWMPYHDPDRPMVQYWFASSEGATIEPFNACIAEAHQDRLEAEGGACIMYTHFAGFDRDPVAYGRFKALMTRLGKKNGWFVPAGTLLDYLIQIRGRQVLSRPERARLERRWLRHKLTTGTS